MVLESIKGANLALRFLLELCALIALAYWGFETGSGAIAKFALGIGPRSWPRSCGALSWRPGHPLSRPGSWSCCLKYWYSGRPRRL